MSTRITIETDTESGDVVESNETFDDIELAKGGEFAEVVEVEKGKGVDRGFTFVWAPILVPESTDHHGDIISAQEIEDTMHQFAMDLNKQKRGQMTNQEGDLNLFHEIGIFKGDADIVEIGVLRAPTKVGNRTLKKGTGVLGVRIYNDQMRSAVKKGIIKGFSIEGKGSEVPV